MKGRVRSGRWQRLYRGVYTAHSGDPARETALWAALLRAGPGAILSHQTAAERHGLIDEPSPVITITVPTSRSPGRTKIPGIVIHRSDAVLRTKHPAMLPPCTRVEDTVLDLIGVAASFDDAYGWICRAIGRRRTTADRIRQAMNARKKMRWRSELALALGDADAGVLSVLEYGVCVELDGTAAHPGDEQWRDKRRDNVNTVRGMVTLRFGWPEVSDRRCEAAADVASLLRCRGWPGLPHSCPRPACSPREGIS